MWNKIEYYKLLENNMNDWLDDENENLFEDYKK